MAENAMSAFLTNIGAFFTQSVTWLGDVLDVITNNPALTVLVIAMPVVGFAVNRGFFRRLSCENKIEKSRELLEVPSLG